MIGHFYFMKQIEGFTNYSIDKNGLVYNTKFNRLIKPFDGGDGYLSIRLNLNGKRYKFKVHRLVALTYLPNVNNKPQVNHINGIKKDNRLDNLEWVTASENMIHAINTGLLKVSDKLRDTGRKNGKLYCSKIVLDTNTGIFYDSVKLASIAYNIDYKYLICMLTGNNKNKTSLKYI